MTDYSYYVYAYLREDGTPYYIGKGKDRRAFVKHVRKDGMSFSPPPIHRIVMVETGLSDVGACAIERRLIRWHGKKVDGGTLVNRADGGNGGGVSGKSLSSEHKRKIRETLTGRIQPRELVEKRRISATGKFRSTSTKQKISLANTGSSRSEEAKRKMSEKALNRPIVCCPHCNSKGKSGIMKRWHFDNCRTRRIGDSQEEQYKG